MLEAGRLRDRINIQRRVTTQDSVTGEDLVTWVDEWANVPAEITDISQRDQLAAQAQQSHVSSRITIRYLEGVTSLHRIVDFDGNVYTIEGPPIRDKESRREFMTLSVSLGPADGL